MGKETTTTVQNIEYLDYIYLMENKNKLYNIDKQLLLLYIIIYLMATQGNWRKRNKNVLIGNYTQL